MNTIAGFPYLEAKFDQNGVLQAPVALTEAVDDLFVISHGWNNNAAEAWRLYENLFKNIATALPPAAKARKLAVVGVIWPSKAFDETVAVDDPAAMAGGAMGVSPSAQSLVPLEEKLDRMKDFFTTPAQQQTLDLLRVLLPKLEGNRAAQESFVKAARMLLDKNAANDEDASTTFFTEQPTELLQRLTIDPEDLAPDTGPVAGGGAAAVGVGAPAASAAEGAAGLKEILAGISAAAMNVLNYTTYYEMKARAGVVGGRGVAPLIDALAPNTKRIHLIGHSFGGRVVTAAALNSTNAKIASMTLLQAAFSHNGFSKTKGGAFRGVVDHRRVNGPIVITHTKNDKAVGLAYPLASRIVNDTTAALGDENDKFGGLGRNGAQQMNQTETVKGKLLKSSEPYAFQAQKFHNLEASEFITGHSDITGKEVANAIRWAIGA